MTAVSDPHYEDKDRERVAIRLRFVGEGSRGGGRAYVSSIAVGGPAVIVLGGVGYCSVRAVH
jgi:hypothetical protein